MPRADNLTTFLCRESKNSGSLKILERERPVQVCKELICFHATQGIIRCPQLPAIGSNPDAY